MADAMLGDGGSLIVALRTVGVGLTCILLVNPITSSARTQGGAWGPRKVPWALGDCAPVIAADPGLRARTGLEAGKLRLPFRGGQVGMDLMAVPFGNTAHWASPG